MEQLIFLIMRMQGVQYFYMDLFSFAVLIVCICLDFVGFFWGGG